MRRILQNHLLILGLLSVVVVIGVFAFGIDVHYANASNDFPERLIPDPLDLAGDALNWVGENAIGGTLAFMAQGILSLMGVILWFAGVLLNYSLSISVINMGSIVDSIGAIEIGWQIFRDVANIALIFGLIAIGVSIMLRVGGFSRLLPPLIIAALLVNFSLFFTQFVVDINNRIAYEVYGQIENITGKKGIAEGCAKGGGTDPGYQWWDAGVECADIGLSEAITDAFNLSTIYKVGRGLSEQSEPEENAAVAGFTNELTNWKIFYIGIGGSIFVLIAAFIFFAVAFLLLMRMAVLILLMVVSPIGVVGMAIPGAQKLAKNFWSALINNAIFAPVFLLLLYIVLVIILDDGFLAQMIGRREGQEAFSGLFGGNPSAIVVLANFIIIAILLVATLIIAKKLSLAGSNQTIKWGKGLQRWGLHKALRPAVWGWDYARYEALNRMGEFGRGAEKDKDTGELKGTWAQKLGSSRLGTSLRKIPRVTETAVQAGRAHRRFIEDKQTRRFKGLRSGEIETILRSSSARFRLTTTEVAALKQIQAENSLDELTIKEVRDAASAYKKTGFGTHSLKVARPDAFMQDMKEAEGTVKMLKDEDFQKFHHRVGSLFEDDGEYKGGSAEVANTILNNFTKAFTKYMNGRTLPRVVADGSELSNRVINRILDIADTRMERSSAAIIDRLRSEDPWPKFDPNDGSEESLGGSGYYRDLARTYRETGDEDTARLYEELSNRRESVAKWLESTNAKRLMGLDQRENRRNNPPQGQNQQRRRRQNTQGSREQTAQNRTDPAQRGRFVRDPETGEYIPPEELDRRQEQREREGR